MGTKGFDFFIQKNCHQSMKESQIWSGGKESNFLKVCPQSTCLNRQIILGKVQTHDGGCAEKIIMKLISKFQETQLSKDI